MEDTNNIAIFHYKIEQNIRALSLYGGNIKTPLTLPPSWSNTTQHLREILLKRAAFLEESSLHEYIEKSLAEDGQVEGTVHEETSTGTDQVRETVRKPSHGYERFFVKLYMGFYEGRTIAAEAISLPTFQNLVNDHLTLANIHPHPQTEQHPLPELPEDQGQSQRQKPATHDITLRKSLIVLDHLANLFIGNQWYTEITNLRSLGTVHPSEAGKTLIGVLGTPDAGQASIVNAIIGANLLTDTDSAGMGVTTTVAYNVSQQSEYYAEIDFLTPDEWQAELRILLADIAAVVDSEDEMSSEAARAMDKLRAVYACSEKEILGSTAERLMQQRQVLDFLDQEVSLQTDDLRVFIAALDRYRPSASVSAGKPDIEKCPMQASTPHRWPLVREIRLFTKAQALSTGATLVSLPTAHDSNRARVAVAERYMKQCDVHWIVVPVTRAMDECLARDLFGDLRLQLHLDSGFYDLAFVCTETASAEMCEKKETCISLKKTIRELKRSSAAENVDTIHEAQGRKKALEVEINNEKINARSESVSRHEDARNTLRHDYTQGLSDFYNAIKADELLMLQAGGWSHRDQDIEDHTEEFRSLGMQLPVFCIDTDFPSRTQEDIEQLQSFCVRLTAATQWQSGVRFLMHVRELLAAIALWASAGYGLVTEEEKEEIEEKFSQSLDNLEDDVDSSRISFTKSVAQSLTDNVLDKFSATTDLVCELDIWDGIACGLPVNTYQAISRRNGVFGLHNWNQELANLAIRPLVPGWKNVFEFDIPVELEWIAKVVKTQVYSFHQRIVSLVDDGNDDSQLWLSLYSAMKHEMNGLGPELRTLHRDLNRDFAIGVEQAMGTAYADGNMHAYSAYYIYTRTLQHVRRLVLQFMHSIERRVSTLMDALVQQTGRHYRDCLITPVVRPFTLDQLRLKNDAADVVHTAQRELQLDQALADELQWEDARERFYHGVINRREKQVQHTKPRRRRHSKRRPLRLMGRIQEV